MLADEYERQRLVDRCYASEVFKDRDDHDPSTAVLPEKKAVRDFYHLCRQTTQGVLVIGEESYRLLGYEWPNQGSESGRRADMVALNSAGGLVVFEAKLENRYSPFAGVLEGLDYLACLTCAANFAKVESGFLRWNAKAGNPSPTIFTDVVPRIDALHEVIVLGSPEYYGRFDRSGRGNGWKEFVLAPAPAKNMQIGRAHV